MTNRLRDLREDKDLTQEECAKIAYIAKNTYIRYEKGERIPTLDVLIKYAEFYNTSIDYIAKITNTKIPYPRIQKKITITKQKKEYHKITKL